MKLQSTSGERSRLENFLRYLSVRSTLRSRFSGHQAAAARWGRQAKFTPDNVPVYNLPISELNDPNTEAVLQAVAPDVIFVVSAPLLKEHIFRQASLGSVNLHFGIAPRYRGENTLFWPLRERSLDGLGITFHRIDNGIDTGPVQAKGFPALAQSAGEQEIWLQCIDLATRMVSPVLSEMKEGIPGEKGRLYPMRRRGIRDDILERIFPFRYPARAESILV